MVAKMISNAGILFLLILLIQLSWFVCGDESKNFVVSLTEDFDVSPIKDTTINSVSRKNMTAQTKPTDELPAADQTSSEKLPKPLSQSANIPQIELGKLPEFPKRPDAVYFIVAVAGGAKMWARTLARTLIDMGTPFGSPQGPPLRPLFVDIPQNGK